MVRYIDADKALNMEFEEMMRHLENGCDYDTDKVEERLQSKKKNFETCVSNREVELVREWNKAVDECMEIVKAGGVNARVEKD